MLETVLADARDVFVAGTGDSVTIVLVVMAVAVVVVSDATVAVVDGDFALVRMAVAV